MSRRSSVGYWRVVTGYAGDPRSGNRHTVRGLGEQLLPADPPALNGDILVELSYQSASRRAAARFSQAGKTILRCGSGTLAAAHVLFQEIGATGDLVLETAAGALPLLHQDGWCGYAALPLPITPTLPPDRPLFDQPAQRFYLVGDDSDYLLAVFNSEQAVRNLHPHRTSICSHSKRSVIATARSADRAAEYVLRYFAPQYGNDEDSATGSANVVLGHFWSSQLRCERLLARQLSPAGGAFRIHAPGLRELETGTAVSVFARGHTLKQLSLH